MFAYLYAYIAILSYMLIRPYTLRISLHTYTHILLYVLHRFTYYCDHIPISHV
jgi:hypothetical protein